MPTFSLYEVLGIDKGATHDQVRKAYKKKALETHPDRAPAEQKDRANEAFRAVSAAYEVLSDAEKRREYDRRGDVEPPQSRQPPPGRSFTDPSARARPPPPPPGARGASRQPQPPGWDIPRSNRRQSNPDGYSSEPEGAPRRRSRSSRGPTPVPPTHHHRHAAPPFVPPPGINQDGPYYYYQTKMYVFFGDEPDSPYRNPFGDPFELFDRMFASEPRERLFQGTRWTPPEPGFPFGRQTRGHAFTVVVEDMPPPPQRQSQSQFRPAQPSGSRTDRRRSQAAPAPAPVPPPRPPPPERRQYYATDEVPEPPHTAPMPESWNPWQHEHESRQDRHARRRSQEEVRPRRARWFGRKRGSSPSSASLSSRSPSPEPVRMWDRPPPPGMPNYDRRRRPVPPTDGVPIPPLGQGYTPPSGPLPPEPIYAAHAETLHGPPPPARQRWHLPFHLPSHQARASTPPPQPTYQQRRPPPPPMMMQPNYSERFDSPNWRAASFTGIKPTIFSPPPPPPPPMFSPPPPMESPPVRGWSTPEARAHRGNRSFPALFSPDYRGGRYHLEQEGPYEEWHP